MLSWPMCPRADAAEGLGLSTRREIELGAGVDLASAQSAATEALLVDIVAERIYELYLRRAKGSKVRLISVYHSLSSQAERRRVASRVRRSRTCSG